MSEAGADDLPQQPLIVHLRSNLRSDAQGHDGAPNLRHRAKSLRRHVEKPFSLAVGFDQDREITTLSRPWLGHYPINHLTLKHQRHFADTTPLFDPYLPNCRAHV